MSLKKERATPDCRNFYAIVARKKNHNLEKAEPFHTSLRRSREETFQDIILINTTSINPDENEWEPIDAAILVGDPLVAIMRYREVISCNLGTAIFAIQDRFQVLATTRKEEFTVDIATYWNGFYS